MRHKIPVACRPNTPRQHQSTFPLKEDTTAWDRFYYLMHLPQQIQSLNEPQEEKPSTLFPCQAMAVSTVSQRHKDAFLFLKLKPSNCE